MDYYDVRYNINNSYVDIYLLGRSAYKRSKEYFGSLSGGDAKKIYTIIISGLSRSNKKQDIEDMIKKEIPLIDGNEVSNIVETETQRILLYMGEKNERLQEEAERLERATAHQVPGWEDISKGGVIHQTIKGEEGNYSFQMGVTMTMVTGSELKAARLPAERNRMLEYKIEKCIKSEGGLCPHEIIILEYLRWFTTDQDDFWINWKLNYDIEEMRPILNGLHERGFIATCGLEPTLKKMKVDELKSILSEIGLEGIGKKEELIKTILGSDKIGIVEMNYPRRYYELTDLGRKELKAGEYLRFIRDEGSFSGLDIWSFNRLVGKETARYMEIFRSYLKKRTIDPIYTDIQFT